MGDCEMSTPNANESKPESTPEVVEKSDFIRERVRADLQAGLNDGLVVTRFPPEPNGYLHIGHAKAICLSYGISQEFPKTRFHLRFDDTNPTTESTEYVDSIKADVSWLGGDWGENLFYASDYFERLYQCAVTLIKRGKAFVCDLSQDEVREYRGTPTVPGRESPSRNRSVEENLDLFDRMRKGEFQDGAKTLRAKIDMASPNIHLRDPALYRIRRAHHHRTGDAWCLYPMYDFTHCLSDSFEGITHSLCTLEFEVHRPLYDWVIDECEEPHHPQQIEFARLNLSYTVLSKRKLLELVENKHVDGWDDPRMPTLSGMRRRGIPPEAIRAFCDRIGVTKYDGLTDVALLEHSIRTVLNRTAQRRFAVLKPLKLIIDNYPEGQSEEVEAINNPEDPAGGTRRMPFGRELYIERDDFMEDPPKKFFRLGPDREVRLKYGFIIKCVGYEKDPATGEVTAVHCEYDPDSRRGGPNAGRKVKAAIHWVSASHAVEANVKLYDRLFTVENPTDVEEGSSWLSSLNPDSVDVLEGCQMEPSLTDAKEGEGYQFERLGYFCLDHRGGDDDLMVFNRTVTLRDAWAKFAKKK